MGRIARFTAVSLFVLVLPALAGQMGYYRQPAIHGDTIVFVAEGDLWKASAVGGVATRLTSHPGDESRPAISPDGATLAFSATYEGPQEVYTMSLAGGAPVRRSFEGGVSAWGWTRDGRIIASLREYSTLPSEQLILIDARSDGPPRAAELVPLAQAADGCYDDAGALYFTRLPPQGSHTRRYKGGTAQSIWRFKPGDAEAAPLTADYPGTSRRPMLWQGRVYFATDRDGVMNLWSMKPDGGDLRQHTRHRDYEVLSPSLGDGRIVYQHGADLRLYDIAADRDAPLAITLDSDFDQTRERWVEKPLDYMTAWDLAPDGSRIAITARGLVFVAPHRQGRLVEATHKPGVRNRSASFMPDGKSLLVLSDESGEVEFWTIPADGVGEARQLTRDADVLRWSGAPSPDGKWLAHHDKHLRLWLLNIETGENRKIDEGFIDDFADLAWSPDSRWLAYVKPVENMFRTIRLLCVADGAILDATTDRFDSFSPVFSRDGKWLYFLSDRNLRTVVPSPWGNYQPEPFLDKKTRIYLLAFQSGLRSPFAPTDELHPDDKKDADKKDDDKKVDDKPDAASQPATTTTPSTALATTTATTSAESRESNKSDAKKPPETKVDRDGLRDRLFEAPIPPGNYGSLSVNDKALFWLSTSSDDRSKTALVAAKIARENVETKTVVAEVRGYQLSADGKKLGLRKGDSLYIIDAEAASAELDKKEVVLSGWSLSVTPREEWRQMYTEAWRLLRDYFYDRDMHGVDWKAMHAKYLPLAERVAARGELSDVLAQLSAELSALHHFVRGGDLRRGRDDINPAALGALLTRDEPAGGYRVAHIYRSDPDEPALLSPLARPGVEVGEGDVIEQINGVATLSVGDPSQLLRQKARQQVLLRVKPAAGGEARSVVVAPLTPDEFDDLRYREWELQRREMVEKLGAGKLGYVHLRAMGGGNFTEFAKAFYPVFNRQGLILDVRHNRGGNIDSWILGRLIRKAWFTWSQRVGQAPSWNMQYAFRGHLAALCNEYTASDGEAFAEGFKRLGLGQLLGTRTWGGEIWLSSSNFLVDGGIATAAEFGVFGFEGQWLIEGHGVEPDVVVDNLPHATFKGEDAQLKAAIDHLLKLIREKPVEMPKAPEYPDKSLKP